ncbi:calcium:proton antiporter, partial [Variovorax sp. 2RAF20]
MIVVLSLLSLVLPNFTSSTADGSLVPLQAIVLSVLAAALYAFFLILQMTTHRDLFVQPGLGTPQKGSPAQQSANAPSA